MDLQFQHRPAKRLLVVMPTWVGDSVMATPTLRALRSLYPDAHIAAVVKETIRPVIDACPWVDRLITYGSRRIARRGKGDGGMIGLARRLAGKKFDTAVLLPNSFRSALLARMAGVPRRVGYDRDGRGFLLTDRLLPRRDSGRYIPVPTRDYYLGLARYLGADKPSLEMALFTRPEHDAVADRMLIDAGVKPGATPLVLLNPGANYGDAKIWHPERFAEVGDECNRKFGAAVAVTGAPKERPIIDRVVAAARTPIIDLPARGLDLTLLKSVVRRASIMVTNDTGPRHIAAAFGVPVITVFGPTDPVWSEIDFHFEQKVRVDVFCGPCQKKKCPLDHRCMNLVTSDMVFGRVETLWSERSEAGSGVGGESDLRTSRT